ncbi:hypothetical protein GCM10017667_01590 [Streptomyces filamentosus]|uniref:Uncharacterized protein n=1 Tax=Streptomyces filamentosus TaxID=67294 RepID=A0A919EH88_STRFL|nr:hypothetical protein GCM10017667_01590 [Streptomyces filamentosus]
MLVRLAVGQFSGPCTGGENEEDERTELVEALIYVGDVDECQIGRVGEQPGLLGEFADGGFVERFAGLRLATRKSSGRLRDPIAYAVEHSGDRVAGLVVDDHADHVPAGHLIRHGALLIVRMVWMRFSTRA